MPLDGVTAKCLAAELNTLLLDARLDKIYQPDRYDIILQFRSGSENLRLILSANPASPRIHLTKESRENPSEPPMFCMLLRKHLAGARLLEVSTPEYERIFQFRFVTINELGDKLEKKLIIEIMGRHSNIILMNQENRIHDAILHVDSSISRVREVMPAHPYVLPPSQNKLTPLAALDRIQESQNWLGTAVNQKSLDKALLETLQGFSPQLCEDLLFQAGLDSRMKVSQLNDDQQRELNRMVTFFLLAVLNGHFAPTIFFDTAEATIPIDFHALPLQIYAFKRPATSVSQAMEYFYLERSRQNSLKQKKQALERIISNSLEHARKKLQIHETDRIEGENRDQFRIFGELILANVHLIKTGQAEVQAIDYYQENQPTVLIPLQINLTPAQNAQRFFKLYAKARTRFENGSKLALDDQRDIAYLETLQNALAEAVEPEDILAVRQEISANLWMRDTQYQQAGLSRSNQTQNQSADRLAAGQQPGKPGKKNRRQPKTIFSNKNKQSGSSGKGHARTTALPPRRYTSSDGLTILVGRNNLQNDQLTLKTAQKEDLWLHVQKMPGTHVIVRTNRQPVPEKTLMEAAEIAAWFSRAAASLPENRSVIQAAGNNLKVLVDYCPVANVRKPAGARPGMVIYEHYQTLVVTPKDPQALAGSAP